MPGAAVVDPPAPPAAPVVPVAPVAATPPAPVAPVPNTPPPAPPAPAAAPKALLGDVEGAAKPVTPPAEPLKPLTVPKDSAMTPEHLAEVEKLAKAAGLNQTQAQALVEHEAAQIKARADAQVSEGIKIGNTWAEQAEKDAEIGGAKLPAALANAKRALVALMTPEERQALTAGPLQNHPWLLKLLSRVATRYLTEDTTLPGQPQTAPIQSDPAHDMFGHVFKDSPKTT